MMSVATTVALSTMTESPTEISTIWPLTVAKVRIVHVAPGAGLVDIYVTPVGVGIVNATPAFAGVDFKDETGYVQLDAGMYDVDVTLAGTQTVAISETIDVAIGGVYTALARDAAGGGAPYEVEVLVEL